MANKQRIRKLSLGPCDSLTARNCLTGMRVIADYIDQQNNQRTLVLERPETIQGVLGKSRKSKTAEPELAKP